MEKTPSYIRRKNEVSHANSTKSRIIPRVFFPLFSYLTSVGMKRCQKLFVIELEAGLFEDILSTLLDSHQNGSCSVEHLISWLKTLSQSRGFSSISLAMISRSVKDRLGEVLNEVDSTLFVEEIAQVKSCYECS